MMGNPYIGYVPDWEYPMTYKPTTSFTDEEPWDVVESSRKLVSGPFKFRLFGTYPTHVFVYLPDLYQSRDNYGVS